MKDKSLMMLRVLALRTTVLTFVYNFMAVWQSHGFVFYCICTEESLDKTLFFKVNTLCLEKLNNYEESAYNMLDYHSLFQMNTEPDNSDTGCQVKSSDTWTVITDGISAETVAVMMECVKNTLPPGQ